MDVECRHDLAGCTPQGFPEEKQSPNPASFLRYPSFEIERKGASCTDFFFPVLLLGIVTNESGSSERSVSMSVSEFRVNRLTARLSRSDLSKSEEDFSITVKLHYFCWLLSSQLYPMGLQHLSTRGVQLTRSSEVFLQAEPTVQARRHNTSRVGSCENFLEDSKPCLLFFLLWWR